MSGREWQAQSPLALASYLGGLGSNPDRYSLSPYCYNAEQHGIRDFNVQARGKHIALKRCSATWGTRTPGYARRYFKGYAKSFAGYVKSKKEIVIKTSFSSQRLSVASYSYVHSSPILVTLIMEALSSSETSVLTRATRRNIPEDPILHNHGRENLKSYIALTGWTL
jgi:hypothetical protein